MSANPLRAEDGAHFRNVLGRFPTGVVVVTAMSDDGAAMGATMGSFTSVSLDPPLVAFVPQATSGTWRKIEASGSFCVNVLTSCQEDVCRAMASRASDKFAGVTWRAAGSGSPILDGVAAWIDCDIERVHPAGDHHIVVGRVRDLDVVEPALPLIFYQGGYGRFSPNTLAINDAEFINQLAVVDVARPYMDRLSVDLDVECVAIACVDDEVIVIASSGAPMSGRRLTRVGTRAPFVPPAGYVFAAWSDEATVGAWLNRHTPVGRGDEHRDSHRRLKRIRDRGFSVGIGGAAHEDFGTAMRSRRLRPRETRSDIADLLSRLADDYEPEDISATQKVQTITAPIFGPDGTVVLALLLFGFTQTSFEQIAAAAGSLKSAARAVTSAIQGVEPAVDERADHVE